MVRYKSLYSLKQNIFHLIDTGELDRPLHLIHDFVERIFTEPLCTSQVFGSKGLDRLCQRIGKINLAKIKQNQPNQKTRDEHRPVFVYIVTKLQKSGGHSRVIEDFINARPDAQHIIMATKLAGKSDADYWLSGRNEKVSVFYESAPRASYQKRLTWLQTHLLQIHPDKVYLLNHHQDSVAVAAIQPEMGLDACFYHHGDHHLCLGVYLSHLKHIDPHPMGYRNCRDALGIENVYVPLTVEDHGEKPPNWSFLSDKKLITCTAARSNKVEVPYFINYMDMVPRILKITGGKHIHIGRLSPWAINRIRRGLKRLGIPASQFIYTPWVPSVWNALNDFRVDLYIASFPYGGGLTLIEAMGAGVPVALHNHIYSRLLSGVDLAYPGAFNWRSPDELLDFLSKLTPELLQSQSRAARLHYSRFHRIEILYNFLCNGDNKALVPEEVKHNFTPENDEWACWIEKQISLRRVGSRLMYRTLRSLRDWFNW